MNISKDIIDSLRKKYGEAFYLLDSEQFKCNYKELKKAFKHIYPKFNIAYSYKTNYTPRLCEIVDEFGGYAEIVSDMELKLAKRIGAEPSKIIWNGPIKNPREEMSLLLSGGTVNIDSIEEALFVKEVAAKNIDKMLNVGIRCNYDVDDGVISRFGFDIKADIFKKVLDILLKSKNIKLINFQCHFAKRQIEYWSRKVNGMLDLIENIGIIPERIDVGGGLFGKMEEPLKKQFTSKIPSYNEYAEVIAKPFAKYFKGKKVIPELVIEPGSALVGDCMKFIGTIKTIKTVRGKTFITVLGSQQNISMGNINPPIKIINMGGKTVRCDNADIVGLTCIEGDCLYKNYTGEIAIGDTMIISNCGSYSVVMKPPFILPNFPVLDICGSTVEVIKRQETFEDIFSSFIFREK